MLGCEDDKIISSILTNSVYSLATDGSTDMDDSKLYPVVVRYLVRYSLCLEKNSSRELPCSVSDILIDDYYFLDKSASRKQHFKEFQGLYDKETRKILQLVNTRWLLLGVCLNRILDMWKSLKKYFHCEKENKTRFKRI
ncbi:uncharacterized protein LOC143249988 [Tachypleus tridentatus]|uniref:uncharacterized protein LOC143249988 n=1 Tax=Tachypleus tridentatus TaxID=6853 RepID=UPI003FD5CAEC